MECTKCEKRLWVCGKHCKVKQVEDPTWHSLNLPTHLLKHHQVSWRPNMECTKCKRVLKSTNIEFQNDKCSVK